MNDKHIKIFTVNTSSKTAGLSPANNERIEIFFAGCKMAREGNPCEGCFNKDLWYDDSFYDETPKTIIENIKKTTDGKNCYNMYGSRLWYIKCRRLTKTEIEDLC